MSVRSNSVERRMLTDVRLEVTDRKIRGIAVVFDSLSLDLGGFREIIKPSAVDRTLREGLDVRAMIDHDTGKIIGRTRAGTLSLRKTRKGLEVEIDPPNTSYARDLLESVDRGDISGMSFAFRVFEGGDDWRMERDGPIRDVSDMTISEVSVVGFPAYPDTDVTVAQRSLEQFRQQFMGHSVEHRRRCLKTLLAR